MRVLYSCIPFGISNVSGFSLLFVCACSLFFVLGCARLPSCNVILMSMWGYSTADSSLMDEFDVVFG